MHSFLQCRSGILQTMCSAGFKKNSAKLCTGEPGFPTVWHVKCCIIRYIYIIVVYHVFVFKKILFLFYHCYYYCIFFCSCSISVHFYYLFSIHIIYFIICIYYFSFPFYPFYFLVYFNICILCLTFIFIEFALLLYLPSISILYWYIYLYSVYVPFVVNGRAIDTDLLLLNTKLLFMEINGYQS